MESGMKKHKVVLAVDRIEWGISIAALGVMLAVVFWQVFSRFVLNHANSWSEELARSLNVLLVYISTSYGVRFKEHIKIDIMIKVFPRVIRPYITFFGELLMLVFFVFLAVKGFELAASVLRVDRVTSGIGIKTGYLYLFAPVGFSFCTIRLVQGWVESFVSALKGRRQQGERRGGGDVR
jgi:TRAP-type C4-dicarboxylate transport system permease small subunit